MLFGKKDKAPETVQTLKEKPITASRAVWHEEETRKNQQQHGNDIQEEDDETTKSEPRVWSDINLPDTSDAEPMKVLRVTTWPSSEPMPINPPPQRHKSWDHTWDQLREGEETEEPPAKSDEAPHNQRTYSIDEGPGCPVETGQFELVYRPNAFVDDAFSLQTAEWIGGEFMWQPPSMVGQPSAARGSDQDGFPPSSQCRDAPKNFNRGDDFFFCVPNPDRGSDVCGIVQPVGCGSAVRGESLGSDFARRSGGAPGSSTSPLAPQRVAHLLNPSQSFVAEFVSATPDISIPCRWQNDQLDSVPFRNCVRQPLNAFGAMGQQVQDPCQQQAHQPQEESQAPRSRHGDPAQRDVPTRQQVGRSGLQDY